MKLTRKQELALIELGFQKVLEVLNGGTTTVEPKRKPGRKRSYKWTPEQREKFRETMRKKWAARKKLSKSQ